MNHLILLSGPVGVGKTAVADELVSSHSFKKIRSGDYLRGLAEQQSKGTSRTDLQSLGDALDLQTDYRWLIDDVAQKIVTADTKQDSWLFDSVRKVKQVFHFKTTYDRLVIHVHLTATEDIIKQRYETRLAEGGEYVGNTAYIMAISHPNEVESRSLITVADLVVDLSQMSSKEAATEIILKCDIGGYHASSGFD